MKSLEFLTRWRLKQPSVRRVPKGTAMAANIEAEGSAANTAAARAAGNTEVAAVVANIAEAAAVVAGEAIVAAAAAADGVAVAAVAAAIATGDKTAARSLRHVMLRAHRLNKRISNER